MENPEASSGSVPLDKVEVSKADDGTAPPPKKPGSKAQGRKRTKSGCLSKSIHSLLYVDLLPSTWLTLYAKPAERGVSNAAKRGQLARIAQSPNASVKATTKESCSKTLSVPIGRRQLHISLSLRLDQDSNLSTMASYSNKHHLLRVHFQLPQSQLFPPGHR